MKKIALKIAIMLTALFVFAGISYAYWTDEVDVFVNAGTGETDLKITGASILSGNSQNVSLQNSKHIESISIDDLDSTGVKIAIQFKNTGTIPVHVDYLQLYSFKLTDGKKTDSKNIKIIAKLFVRGNKILYKETSFDKIRGRSKSITIRPNRTIRLEPGEEATIHLTLTFNSKKDNGKGKDKDKDKDKGNSPVVSFDFDIGIIYSRYNE